MLFSKSQKTLVRIDVKEVFHSKVTNLSRSNLISGELEKTKAQLALWAST